MSKQAPVILRNKIFGSRFRIIRTTSDRAGDLHWVTKAVYDDGTESKYTAWISVDLWATGDWEVSR